MSIKSSGNDSRRPQAGFRLSMDTLEDRNAPGSLSSMSELLGSIKSVKPSNAIATAVKVAKSPTSAARTSSVLSLISAAAPKAKVGGSTLAALSGVQTTNSISIPFFGNQSTTIGTAPAMDEGSTTQALNQAAQTVLGTSTPSGISTLPTFANTPGNSDELASYVSTLGNSGNVEAASGASIFDMSWARTQTRWFAPTSTAATREWLITTATGANARTLATSVGATFVRDGFIANTSVWRFPTTISESQINTTLSAKSQITSFVNLRAEYQKSPFFAPNDPLFNTQWHLNNTGQGGGLKGIDIGAVKAWDTAGAFGNGVVVGVLDWGTDLNHADLQPNLIPSLSYPNGGAAIIPGGGADNHGTAVAGLIAARGNNGRGVTGVAPNARFGSVNIASSDPFAAATGLGDLNFDLTNNSWGYPFPFSQNAGIDQEAAAIQFNALNGRDGLGAVTLIAAGNSGAVNGENKPTTVQMLQNSPYAVNVGALANNGKISSYSQRGSSVFLVAPSNGGTLGMVTTDRGYDNSSPPVPIGYNVTPGEAGYYTNDFGGTSAATPVTSGVVSMILGVNPNLGRRDVEAILAKSAVKVDQNDSSWGTNAAGYNISETYGFGLIKADKAVTLAKTWTNLPAMQSFSSTKFFNNTVIPDNSATGVTGTFDLSFLPDDFVIERVVLGTSITHPANGDLDIDLTSPGGTTVKMARSWTDNSNTNPTQQQSNIAQPSSWDYQTPHFMGENVKGTWGFDVSDIKGGFEGILNSLTLQVFGYQKTTGGGGNPPGGGGGTPVAPSDGSADKLFEANETSNKARTITTEQNNLAIAVRTAKQTPDRDWFKYVAPASGVLTVKIDMATSADLDLRVYTPVKPGSTRLRELSAGTGATRGATTSEQLSFTAVAGTTYYFNIVGFNRATANYNFNIT